MDVTDEGEVMDVTDEPQSTVPLAEQVVAVTSSTDIHTPTTDGGVARPDPHAPTAGVPETISQQMVGVPNSVVSPPPQTHPPTTPSAGLPAFSPPAADSEATAEVMPMGDSAVGPTDAGTAPPSRHPSRLLRVNPRPTVAADADVVAGLGGAGAGWALSVRGKDVGVGVKMRLDQARGQPD